MTSVKLNNQVHDLSYLISVARANGKIHRDDPANNTNKGRVLVLALSDKPEDEYYIYIPNHNNSPQIANKATYCKNDRNKLERWDKKVRKSGGFLFHKETL
ncbi:hypothetical protein [Shimazuella alba]|uniref:Uncharacterized protein n=1 Tax=Shimazuella alba TaxID=2690964 RepID=A0A6I4W1K1_9BACL|nr:hypothetical protein [Shimazuella alba]MXQ54142.1 hypothetical protein [Shimazuella alba]